MSVLPPLALAACLPSLVLREPMRWALSDSASPVPIPALGANVLWNLATNSVLAAAMVVTALLLR